MKPFHLMLRRPALSVVMLLLLVAVARSLAHAAIHAHSAAEEQPGFVLDIGDPCADQGGTQCYASEEFVRVGLDGSIAPQHGELPVFPPVPAAARWAVRVDMPRIDVLSLPAAGPPTRWMRLRPRGFGTDANVDWSPDGTRFSLWTDDDDDWKILVANPVTRRSWVIRAPRVAAGLEGLAWVSRQMIAAIYYDSDSDADTAGVIVFDARSGRLRRRLSNHELGGIPNVIAWSAGAERLAVQVLGGAADGAGPVRVVDPFGTHAPVRTSLRGFGASWAPNGRYLSTTTASRTMIIAWPSGMRVASISPPAVEWLPDSSLVVLQTDKSEDDPSGTYARLVQLGPDGHLIRVIRDRWPGALPYRFIGFDRAHLSMPPP